MNTHLEGYKPYALGKITLPLDYSLEMVRKDLAEKGIEAEGAAATLIGRPEFSFRPAGITQFACVGIPVVHEDQHLHEIHLNAVRSGWRQPPALILGKLLRDRSSTPSPFKRLVIHHEPIRPTHVGDPFVLTVLMGDASEPTMIGVMPVGIEKEKKYQLWSVDLVVYWNPRG